MARRTSGRCGAAGAGADCATGAGADCACTGAVLACFGRKAAVVMIAGGAGGASCAGGAGIVAGSAGTRRTWPIWMSSAHRIWSWFFQYSTGQASVLSYTRPAIAESVSPDLTVYVVGKAGVCDLLCKACRIAVSWAWRAATASWAEDMPGR